MQTKGEMKVNDYSEFLESKKLIVHPVGREVEPGEVSSTLFSFQRDLARWAVRKGRAALFADTGLGKTAMQVEIARLIGGRSLIIAPLSVTRQTVRMANELLGVAVHYTRSGSDLIDGINITNYEMVEHFDPSLFASVHLDESSILKALEGKTRRMLTEMFQPVPYRFCYTATPAPNDITEIGRHAEFLGIMTNEEMLAAFFINDMKQKDGVYRLKKHAVEKFYQWLSSWGMAIKRPSDIGYADDGYILPDLNVHLETVNAHYTPPGMLEGFWDGQISAIEARAVRRETMTERIEATRQLVNGNSEQWVIWCGLNAEAEALADAIPGSINVHGSMSPEEKADLLWSFVNGERRVLITKTSIAGFGINMQVAHNMVFCGIDYSWESYYQAVRRMYRFGQQHPVNVHVITSQQERAVWQSIQNKEREAVKMTEELIKHSAQYARVEIMGIVGNDYEYETDEAEGQQWKLFLGDSTERINEIADESVDLSVFSPPFVSLYTYTPTERDMGNSRSEDQFFEHFAYIINGLMRITKPGRNCAVHVQQVAAFKSKDGYIGIKDFRGDVIRAFDSRGWIFHGEVTIDKNPQVQAIRTKTKGLMFQQLHKDSAANRPAFGDYLLIFQKPGENAVPVVPDVTNEEWIEWAHPIWYDIRESDVLNVAIARSEEDERHLCPLQLPLIERTIRLYTNRGETVFTPFAGVGSEVFEAVRLGRRGVGIELKREYWRQAVKNVKNAAIQGGQRSLFELLEAEESVLEGEQDAR